MCVCRSAVILAVLATLCLDGSVADYSLYISEERLQSYYSNTAHAELVLGHRVEIVSDGELAVGEDGALLLSPVGDDTGSGRPDGSGSGDSGLLPASGSGISEHNLLQRSLSPSLSPSSLSTLPPLPANVDAVDFTWNADTMVDYTLRAVQRGGQLTTPRFNVTATGSIPLTATTLRLSVACMPLSVGTGRVEVNLTTSASSPPFSVSFFLLKSCSDDVTPSPSTMFPQVSTSQEHTSTPLFVPSSLPLLPSTPSHPTSPSSPAPSSHPLPPDPTPFLSTPGLPPSPSTSSLLPTIASLPPDSSPTPPPLLPFSPTPTPSSFTPSPSPFTPSPSSFTPSPSPFTPSPFSFTPSPSSFTPSPSPSTPSPSSFTPSPSPFTPSPSSFTPLSSSFTPSPSSFTPSPSPSFTHSPSPFTPSTFSFTPSSSSFTPSTSPSLPLSPSTTVSLPPELPSQSPSPSLEPPPSSKLQTSTPPLSASLHLTSQPAPTTSLMLPSPPLVVTARSSLEEISPSSSVRVTAVSLTSHRASSVDLSSSTSGAGAVSTMQPSSTVVLSGPESESGGEVFTTLLVMVCAPVGGALLACILLACCLLLCLKLRARRRKTTHVINADPLDVVQTVPYSPAALGDETSLKKAPPRLSLWMSLPWGAVSSLPRSIQTLIAQFTVDRKSLSIIDTVIRGEHGSVVSGQLNMVRTDVMTGSQSVAMKILTGLPEGSRREEVVRFLEAATLLKGISHPHIVPVLRVSVEDGYVPLVVYPMLQHPDMHRVMKLAANPEHSALPPLTTWLKLELAVQIATAMSYLAEHGITHPDLALRNCQLDSECRVHVSDGALAQEFHPDCYHTVYGAVRPVRWAAVETLQEGLCTARSNVWSYAVTVWEILTYAEMPYSEVNNNRSILSHIKMGARLPRPHTCPEPLYELLCNCWSDRGEERPNFNAVVSQLQRLQAQFPEVQVQQRGHAAEPAPVPTQPNSQVPGEHAYAASIFGKGRSVSREWLPTAGGDSPRSRNRVSHRETSHGHVRRVSMASMLSRGSTAGDKLSITFSVLSTSDILSGSSSEEETEFDTGEGLQMNSSQPPQVGELHSMLHQVRSSFVGTSTEDARQLPATPPTHSVDNDTLCSVNTTILSDSSSTTVVPPALSSPGRTPKTSVMNGETTSLASSNPISVTPPPSQATDTYSKTSTLDLESVSTFMSAPYTSSPIHSTSFLYQAGNNGGYGVTSTTEEAKRGDRSPLLVDHKAQANGSPYSPIYPSRPSAKSTDSGIRSDEDADIVHTPTTHIPLAPAAAHTPTSCVTTAPNTSNGAARGVRGNEGREGGLEVSDLSSSLMAAFDTWGTTAQ